MSFLHSSRGSGTVSQCRGNPSYLHPSRIFMQSVKVSLCNAQGKYPSSNASGKQSLCGRTRKPGLGWLKGEMVFLLPESVFYRLQIKLLRVGRWEKIWRCFEKALCCTLPDASLTLELGEFVIFPSGGITLFILFLGANRSKPQQCLQKF